MTTAAIVTASIVIYFLAGCCFIHLALRYEFKDENGMLVINDSITTGNFAWFTLVFWWIPAIIITLAHLNPLNLVVHAIARKSKEMKSEQERRTIQ